MVTVGNSLPSVTGPETFFPDGERAGLSSTARYLRRHKTSR